MHVIPTLETGWDVAGIFILVWVLEALYHGVSSICLTQLKQI
jgi:hypothetical protein